MHLRVLELYLLGMNYFWNLFLMEVDKKDKIDQELKTFQVLLV